MSDLADADAAERAGRPRGTRWLALGLVTLAALQPMLDGATLPTALRYVAGHFAGSYDETAWLLTVYPAAIAVGLLGSGWLARLLGPSRVLAAALVAFAVFSVLCTTAHTLTWFSVWFVLHGVCGGGLIALQLVLVLERFASARRTIALAVTALAVVGAQIWAYALGRYMYDMWSWRMIYMLNVVPCVPALFCLGQFRSRRPSSAWWPIVDPRVLRDRNFLAGMAMMCGFGTVLSAGAYLLAWLGSYSADAGPTTPAVLAVALALILTAAFVPIARRAFATLPGALHADGSALFGLARLLSGYVAVAVAVALTRPPEIDRPLLLYVPNGPAVLPGPPPQPGRAP